MAIGARAASLAALKTFIHDIPKPDGKWQEIELFEQQNGLDGIWSVPHFTSTLANTFSDAGYRTIVQPGDLPETLSDRQLHTNVPVSINNTNSYFMSLARKTGAVGLKQANFLAFTEI